MSKYGQNLEVKIGGRVDLSTSIINEFSTK
jgi:hypothetical protein